MYKAHGKGVVLRYSSSPKPRHTYSSNSKLIHPSAMSIRVAVLPASSQAGKATIDVLLKQEKPPLIRAIYRDPSRAPEDFTKHPNFAAVQGDVAGDIPLNFDESDVVFYIPPPIYDGSDSATFATHGANKVKRALEASKVQRVLVFSAQGAQHASGIVCCMIETGSQLVKNLSADGHRKGVLKINHTTDMILKDSVPEVVIVRPGWFAENWASALDTVRSNPEDPYFDYHFSPVDNKIRTVRKLDGNGQLKHTVLLMSTRR